jgi:hypothetical protein
MNPLRWPIERKVAFAAFCIFGALGGVFFAWLESPLRRFAADRGNYGSAFVFWLGRIDQYWPWLLYGALAAACLFYAVELARR